jgi:hypothetical protein
MSALDPFALGGRQDGDKLILAAFQQWIAAMREYSDTEDEDAENEAYHRMVEIEDEIDATPGGCVAFAVKVYLGVRREFTTWAPGCYLRCDKEELPGLAREVGLLRDAGRAVPEIAEFAAAIMHDDAELIDAEMDIQWARVALLGHEAPGPDAPEEWRQREEKWRQCVESKRRAAFDRIADVEAKTERGKEIKARHAGGAA